MERVNPLSSHGVVPQQTRGNQLPGVNKANQAYEQHSPRLQPKSISNDYQPGLSSSTTDKANSVYQQSSGAPVQRRTNALHKALREGSLEEAKHLINHGGYGGDINAPDEDGWTPLHLAVWRQPQLLELIIKKGGDVNAKDDNGNTPLHLFASKYGMSYSHAWGGPEFASYFNLLIDNGAKFLTYNDDHRLPSLPDERQNFSPLDSTPLVNHLHLSNDDRKIDKLLQASHSYHPGEYYVDPGRSKQSMLVKIDKEISSWNEADVGRLLKKSITNPFLLYTLMTYKPDLLARYIPANELRLLSSPNLNSAVSNLNQQVGRTGNYIGVDRSRKEVDLENFKGIQRKFAEESAPKPTAAATPPTTTTTPTTTAAPPAAVQRPSSPPPPVRTERTQSEGEIQLNAKQQDILNKIDSWPTSDVRRRLKDAVTNPDYLYVLMTQRRQLLFQYIKPFELPQLAGEFVGLRINSLEYGLRKNQFQGAEKEMKELELKNCNVLRNELSKLREMEKKLDKDVDELEQLIIAPKTDMEKILLKSNAMLGPSLRQSDLNMIKDALGLLGPSEIKSLMAKPESKQALVKLLPLLPWESKKMVISLLTPNEFKQTLGLLQKSWGQATFSRIETEMLSFATPAQKSAIGK